MSSIRLAHTVLAAGLVTAALTPAAAARPLTAHRAVYDITLDRALAGSGVSDMTGRMVYELTGSACEGYTQNMRFVTRMTSQEGQVLLNDLRSSSWEDAAAKSFRFNSNSYKNTQLADTTQGDAARRSDAVKVDIKRPATKAVTLGGGVYFPVQHSIALLDAARAGQPVFAADLYDGSEKGEKVYATTTVIGRGRVPASRVTAAGPVRTIADLESVPSWPVSISYFDPGADRKDAVPSYELAFRFYENGISSKLFIDYGEFSIRGELKELQVIDQPACKEDKR